MNIHLITYLTSKLFWIYTVFRYNTILYPKNEDTQKLFAYFCAYLLSCWESMQWGTMYGDLIFELIALLIITVAYQADWQHHVWNTLMVYIMGILCDGIPIVFFQRYAVARNPVHHHMGPGTIVMGNFIFFLLEVIIERKVDVKRSYYIKNSHWLAMLSVPVISIIVCIRILLPDRRGVRSTIVLFLLFINVFIFYLHDEVQKSYIETAKQEEMKIQMSQYAKELEMMMKSQDRLNKIHHDYKHHLTTIGAMAKTGGNEEILSYLKQMENIAGTALCHHLYTENRNMNNLLNYILEDAKSVIRKPEISVEIPNHIGEDPIWWGEAPRIVSTFMESYDFSGKTIVPFCTSGGSGIGSSASNLERLTSGATWLDGRRLNGSDSQDTVMEWVNSLDLNLAE